MRLEAAGPGLSTAVRGRQSAGEELISPGHMGRSLVRSKPGEKCTGTAGRGIRERQRGIEGGGIPPECRCGGDSPAAQAAHNRWGNEEGRGVGSRTSAHAAESLNRDAAVKQSVKAE